MVFLTYEHLRCKGEGGGLAFIARKDLNPAFVRDGGEEVEALTVDIHVKKMTISCTTAYGPQESVNIEEKKPSFGNVRKLIEPMMQEMGLYCRVT